MTKYKQVKYLVNYLALIKLALTVVSHFKMLIWTLASYLEQGFIESISWNLSSTLQMEILNKNKLNVLFSNFPQIFLKSNMFNLYHKFNMILYLMQSAGTKIKLFTAKRQSTDLHNFYNC